MDVENVSHMYYGRTTSLLDLPDEVCKRKNVATLVFRVRKGDIQGAVP